jgi:DNA-binding SARP family transcriptional activator
MEFQLLGQVAVRAGDRLVGEAVRPQQSVVLAALVVDARRLVPSGVLVDRVWGAEPPSRARRTLQTHIARIRQLLTQADPDRGRSRLRYRTGGYIVDVDADQVDLHRFRRLTRQAQERDCGEEQRAALLDEALRLWRGEPLAGLSGAWVDRVRHGWRQQWLNAVLAWAQAQLRLGRSPGVIDTLTELVDEYPLVEPLTAALMRALWAAGQPAEAICCYTRIRDRLVEQLGADPSGELRLLYQAVLRDDLAPAPRLGLPTRGDSAS